jgi:hypothetical protein
MSEKEDEELKTLLKIKFIIKVIWFIGVFIFVTIVVKYNWEKCSVIIPVLGYSIFFFAFIILLFYPLFDSIKISPTGVIEMVNSDIISKIYEITSSSIKGIIAKNKRITESKKRKAVNFGWQGLLAETDGANEEPDMVLSFEKAAALKDVLKMKHDDITNNKKAKIGKNHGNYLIYETLDIMYAMGIDKMNDDLSEDEYQIWIDYSKNIIETVSNKTDIKLNENYISLIECMDKTEFQPFQKLNACIDYALDIMKYMVRSKP